MCFVWIWEQTAIFSLYSINWLVCITGTECVYCAVRTGYLYIIQAELRLWPCLCSGGQSPASLRGSSVAIFVSECNIFGAKRGAGQVLLPVLRFSLKSVILPLILAYRHLRVALTRRTNGRILGTFQKAMLLCKPGSFGQKVLSLSPQTVKWLRRNKPETQSLSRSSYAS